MSREKRPPKNPVESSKGFTEIDLSGIKDRLDNGLDKLVFDGKSGKSDPTREKGEGRLGLDPIFGTAGIVAAAVTGIPFLLCLFFHAEVGLTLLMLFMFLLGVALTCLGKYEIRFNKDGFSVCFWSKVIRTHRWSEVSDVQDHRKVFVNGKLLLTDHTFDEFPAFYKMARAACKGKGATTPASKKKR